MYQGAPVITGAVAAQAAQRARMIKALKANGAIVQVEPDVLTDILQKSEDAAVVVAKESRWFSTYYAYLTNYKGLFFYAESPELLAFSDSTELILAEKIWIPNN